jgi:hypothetical protein
MKFSELQRIIKDYGFVEDLSIPYSKYRNKKYTYLYKTINEDFYEIGYDTNSFILCHLEDGRGGSIKGKVFKMDFMDRITKLPESLKILFPEEISKLRKYKIGKLLS